MPWPSSSQLALSCGESIFVTVRATDCAGLRAVAIAHQALVEEGGVDVGSPGEGGLTGLVCAAGRGKGEGVADVLEVLVEVLVGLPADKQRRKTSSILDCVDAATPAEILPWATGFYRVSGLLAATETATVESEKT